MEFFIPQAPGLPKVHVRIAIIQRNPDLSLIIRVLKNLLTSLLKFSFQAHFPKINK